MARTILLTGAVGWLVVAVAGLGVALVGRDALLEALPPLAIDADALGGALTVIAVAALGIGAAHATVAVGLGRGSRWARSAGVLLASVMSVVFLALAATAAASALRESALALGLGGACIAAALAAVAYALTAARLVGDLRSGSAI
jgi:hypothetical protein